MHTMMTMHTHMLDEFSVKKCKKSSRQKYSRSNHTRESSSYKIIKKLLFIQRSKWNFQENMVFEDDHKMLKVVGDYIFVCVSVGNPGLQW